MSPARLALFLTLCLAGAAAAAPPAPEIPRRVDLAPGFGAPLEAEAPRAPSPTAPAPLQAALSADPRAVIYPPSENPWGFDHGQHLDLPCLQCHGSVLTSTRAADSHRPPRAVCLECHEVPKLPTAAPGPGPQIKFDHAAHQQQGLACHRCHGGPTGGPARLPDMGLCLDCHASWRGHTSAGSQCGRCHLTDPGGRVLTDLPTGALVPVGRYGLGDHRGDFARRHGPLALAADARCASCHEPARCQTCHTGTMRPVALHPADFLSTHGPAARRDDPQCSSCHQLHSFCADCHRRAGLGQGGGPLAYGGDGVSRGPYHPPEFTGLFGAPPGPGHHGREARRNLDACVSCHTESSCQSCHDSRAPSGYRASPHGADTAALCAGPFRRNPKGCLKCHADGPSLCR